MYKRIISRRVGRVYFEFASWGFREWRIRIAPTMVRIALGRYDLFIRWGH